MTERRGPGGGDAFDRMKRRVSDDRIEALFGHVLDEVKGLREDVLRGSQGQDRVERRMDDLEYQINLTRDEVQRRAINPAPSQIQSAKQAIKESAKSPIGITATVLAIICSGIIIINNIPDAQRVMEKMWVFSRGLDQPVAKMDDKAAT